MRSGDLDAVRIFLSHFEIFPSLHTLSLEQPKTRDRHPQITYALITDLVLPKMTTLHLDVGYAFHLGRPALTTVRTFSLRPYSVADVVINQAIAALPNLHSLRIDFADLMQNAKPAADPAPVHQLAASIPSVTLASVPDRCTPWVLSAFHEPMRPILALERCLGPFNAEFCSIFGDLGHDIRLHVVTTHDRRVIITGVDAQGLERRIDCVRDADLSPLFSEHRLNRDNVVDLSVCTSLLPRIVHAFTNVTTLMLIVDDMSFLDAHPMPPLPAFPTLQTLTLLDGPDVVGFFPGDVSDLVHALSVPLPLKAINIDHRIRPADADELLDLAESLEVGVFHIP